MAPAATWETRQDGRIDGDLAGVYGRREVLRDNERVPFRSEVMFLQNAGLQRQYGVSGYPTLIVVDPAGRKVAELKGYVRGGPKSVIAAIEKPRAN